jgi:polysaccharide export outer membrane protein
MPRAMSSLSEVREASQQGSIKLVPLTAATLPASPTKAEPGLPAAFLEGDEYPYDRLGAGDRLQIRVVESGTPTVFTGSSSADAGQVTIDGSGQIYFPYAGSVHAAGMTIAELREAITRRLQRVVLRPQVDVRVVDTRSKLVTVQGDAAKTGVYPIERGRTRLSSLLAEVAPNQKVPEMLSVIVRRDGQTGEVRLSDVYANSRFDIALRPGDSIILNQVNDSVTVLGAAGVQGQVPISKRDFTVIDALGQARGLDPEAADPSAVFVMRASAQEGAPPIVYQVDMRRPETIALARRFVLARNDAVLISSAPWAVTRQVITAFAQGLAGVRSAAMLPVP